MVFPPQCLWLLLFFVVVEESVICEDSVIWKNCVHLEMYFLSMPVEGTTVHKRWCLI